MKPKSWMYILQILQGQSYGIHNLIFDLKQFRDLQFLISVGISSHILGTIYFPCHNTQF